MRYLQYNLVFRPEPEGGFTVFAPALPGCISYGKTLEEAKRYIQDAIRGYTISLRKHNERIPTDEKSFISSVQVNVS
ncbi:MAG: antitoxin HicB [Candidatus Zambryskibacteria bacterium RIFCSPHIGHO2_01_FULL_44_22b]|uniref:Antitoxin HicB n=2 Tax=Candidatus Zambryskiibacteriota TaxID=1817925 RepID=A0A1G2T2L3_9BACT|nr:MAG: antitoxin HicB [Candidatus Zambryskibacteria bacterium RIFCSPHIGHO2_01_FULL_44_22b]OHB05812.1 MAG: antitoxin HicB [Candidatus Zambryskibacteria bacterium RIFCSPLOWO2_01_FULL_45_43]